MRTSNHLIGAVNFVTFLLSLPILGGGIFLSTRANNTDCLTFLQWPLIVIALSIMVVSLAGLVGSCYRNTLLMKLYLVVMFFVIVLLIGFVIFAYVTTDKGSGRPVPYRAYSDYYLQDYSGWLERRVTSYWGEISSCVRESKVCAKMGRTYNGVPEPVVMFYQRKLTPIESGCCKPLTECGFTYVNETTWTSTAANVNSNDCYLWSNDQLTLCYNCQSCKAGVLSSLKKSWRKVSVINIVVIIVLVIFYVVAYAAYKNNKRIDNEEPYGETRMVKLRPRIFDF